MSWNDVELAEICEVILGQSPPGDTYNTNEKGLPFFQGKGEFGDLFPTAVKWCTAPKKIAEEGDVLISVRAPVGPTNLAREKAAIGRGLAALRPHDGIPARYVLYAIRATVAELRRQATGSTFEAISGSQLRGHRVPLAPLEQREAVVEEIEKQLTRLDAGVSQLRRARANVARLRRSALDVAFFRNGEPLPAMWTQVPVGEIAEVRLGRQRSPKNRSDRYPRPYIRAANVDWGGLKLDDVKEMDFKPNEFETFRLKPGDVLVGEASGSRGEVGKPAVWNGEIEGCCFQNTLIRVRSHKSVDPSYLHLHFLADAMSGRFGDAARGVGIHHLGATTLSKWSVNLAPPQQQAQLAREIARSMSIIEALEREIEAGLKRAVRLRQSILSSVFSGRLLPKQLQDTAGVVA